MSNAAKKAAYYGMFVALCVLVGWLERLVPLPLPVPGIRLGLANSAVLVLFYRDGAKAAITVNAVRIILVNLLFGGISGFVYAALGATLSMCATALLYRRKFIGMTGVSVIGALLHNVGQLCAACLMTRSAAPLTYTPWLAIAAVVTGSAVGLLAALLIRRVGSRAVK